MNFFWLDQIVPYKRGALITNIFKTNLFFQVQNANYIRICGPIDTENDTLPNTPTKDQGSSSNPLTSHFEAARRRTSVSRFYTDQGPREDWDSPLNKVTFMCLIALFT